MRLLVFIKISFVILFLSGCASTPENIPAVNQVTLNYSSGNPSITLFTSPPSAKYLDSCQDHGRGSTMNTCQFNLFDFGYVTNALEESGAFKNVSVGDRNEDYAVVFSHLLSGKESVGDIAKAAIAGATLLLVPMSWDFAVTAEVRVLWRDFEIKAYEYIFPLVQKISLFSDPNAADKNYANKVASLFLPDMTNDRVFSSGFLYESLGASDYLEDLSHPETIEDFRFYSENNFHDPFLGTRINYLHSPTGIAYDVFIYPVRDTNWDDETKVLSSELEIAMNELRLVAKERGRDDILLGDPSTQTLSDGRRLVGCSGMWNENGIEMQTEILIYLAEDKFVKLRVSAAAGVELDAYGFINALSNEMAVPEESLFMARLRQRIRQEKFGNYISVPAKK